jgi:hypothetical protein
LEHALSRKKRFGWWGGWSLFVVLASTGCSPSPHSTAGDTDTARTSSEAKFSGPWASLFESTYAESTTDAERKALADGKISEQEYTYFQTKIVDCLASHGISARFGSDRGLEYTTERDVKQEVINKCNVENGIRIIALHDAIERNPHNLNENEIMVECLKRVRLVDAGYTAAMFGAGVNIDTFINTELFDACNSDPLNYATSK